jgi:transposase
MLSKREKSLRLKMSELFPLLNERQRRILAASEAKAYGRGGVTAVANITGLCRQTIYRGLDELGNFDEVERVRKKSGGRKKLSESMPDVLDAIENIVGPTSRGDPESPLRWTCKSVRKILDALVEQGYLVGRQSVANLLHELDFSLQANRKTSEGKEDHPDRDGQFQNINRIAKNFLRVGNPVIFSNQGHTRSKALRCVFLNTIRHQNSLALSIGAR